MVDLDDTVEEVEKQIRNADDPNYEELLEKEKNGKDRKTIKEFLESKIEGEDEEKEEEVEEEVVEEIEEETKGGVLSDLEDTQVLAGGAIIGLVLGLAIGAVYLPMDSQGISEAEATDKVSTLLTSGQLSAEDVSVSSETRNGMYYINATATQTVNGTERSQSQTYYMTSDGSLMFPEMIQSPLGNQQVAIDVDQAIQRAQQQQAPTGEEPTTSTNSTQ
jgi:hypothetical protein